VWVTVGARSPDQEGNVPEQSLRGRLKIIQGLCTAASTVAEGQQLHELADGLDEVSLRLTAWVEFLDRADLRRESAARRGAAGPSPDAA
jgi:hypothetical protein